jgi:UBX domain-containing protein 1
MIKWVQRSNKASYFLEAAKGDLQEALAAFYDRDSQKYQNVTRIKTFQDVNRKDDGQNLYAGGKNSGIAIQGRRDEPQDDLVKKILEQAAKQGEHEEQVAQKPKFVGTGYRLGSDQVPSSTIPSQPTDHMEPATRLLTFWKEGFSVEDGELLRYDDPQNQEMLKAIQAGRAPVSLLNVLPNQPVEVKVAHRMEESYKAAPKKVKTFSGSGNRLGGMTSSSTTIPGTFPTSTTPSAPKVQVDATQPVTSLQIRLGDGTRLVAKFNHTHTVGDLRQFVQAY